MVIVCNRSLFNKYGWMAFVCYFENSKGTRMTKDEALRLAWEALENLPALSWIPEKDNQVQEAITAIKAVLEAKDEPWEKFCDSNCVWTDHHPDCKLAQRTWVGLTDEEKIIMSRYDLEYAALIGEVERKLKEKNT